MADAKNHHYIPQSYLKNFSIEKNENYFVYAQQNKEKFIETNIKNICTERYLYSIEGVSEDKRNLVEKYYAENIDVLFPEITKIITDDNVSEIDLVTRRKIITAVLSLYFRTPKFLRILETHYKNVVFLLKNYFLGKTEMHKINFLGREIDVKNFDLERMENLLSKQDKIIFLQQHFEILNEYINYKVEDGIGILKIVDDSEFITCDNPVVIRPVHEYGDELDLFNPDNLVHLPINQKYMLTLLPKTDNTMKNTFTKIDGDIKSALIHNLMLEKSSEKWIIGSKKSINKHLVDQIQYNKPTSENLKMVDDLEEKLKLVLDCSKLLDLETFEVSDELLQKLKELNELEIFKDETNLKRNIETLKRKGYKI